MKWHYAVSTLAVLGFAALNVGEVTAEGNTTAEVSSITCANVRCASGTQCVLQQVQCIRAPCPATPACVPIESPSQSAPPNPCSLVLCGDSETCELTQVQCIAAPCEPVATCVPQKPSGKSCAKKCSRFQRCFLYQSKPHCADVCSPSRCGKRERCELRSVQCLVAPCPRVAACVPA